MGFFKNLADKATLRKQVSELRLIELRLGELSAAQRLTLMSTIGESLAKVDGANVRSMTPDQQVVIGIRIQAGAHKALIGAFNQESLASWIVGTWLVVPHMPAGSDQATVEARVRTPCREAWDLISTYVASAEPDAIDELRGRLRIGVHSDVEVTAAAALPGPVVSQAFCSAPPVAYSGLPAGTGRGSPPCCSRQRTRPHC